MASVFVAFFSRRDARLSRLTLLAAWRAVGPSIGLTDSCGFSLADDGRPPPIVVVLRLVALPPRRLLRRSAERPGGTGGGGGGGGGGGTSKPGSEDPSTASQMPPSSVDERRMSKASELDDGDVWKHNTNCYNYTTSHLLQNCLIGIPS